MKKKQRFYAVERLIFVLPMYFICPSNKTPTDLAQKVLLLCLTKKNTISR